MQRSNKELLENSRILRQQSRADIDAVITAMAQSRDIIANSKKLLKRSQDLHQTVEHEERFIVNRRARMHFVAAAFRRSLRN